MAFKQGPGVRWVFGLNAVACLAVVAIALHLWGAEEIRADGGTVFFLTLIAGIGLIVAAKFFTLLGLSFRDDVIGGRNRAALVALCGAEWAVALIYAGGSVGEGPSFADNFFCTSLGTAALVALWFLLDIGGRVTISITEERDLASGIRLCGFLIAVGLFFGRALAGDWHSASATTKDFIHDGWPVLAILAVALIVEKFARPNRGRPFPRWAEFGLVPALFYLALAGAWISHLGPWEGMPHVGIL